MQRINPVSFSYRTDVRINLSENRRGLSVCQGETSSKKIPKYSVVALGV